MDYFYFHFCKVEFLCWAGSPNWLGWLTVLIGILAAGFFALYIAYVIYD